MEEFNKIAAAMVITNQDIEPTDLPTALTEIPVTEIIEHDRLGSLPSISDNFEAAAVTPMVSSLASHPGRRRAKGGEEKVTQDKQKNLSIVPTLCERFCRKHCEEFTRENRFNILNCFREEQYESRLTWLASWVRLVPDNRRSVKFTEQKFKKNESRLYFLPEVVQHLKKKIQVCKKHL